MINSKPNDDTIMAELLLENAANHAQSAAANNNALKSNDMKNNAMKNDDLTMADAMNTAAQQRLIGQRFRGFLPVVVDVETAGFNAKTDALLEIACIPIVYDENGKFIAGEALHAHIQPFEGANLDPRSLEFTGIDPFHPMRMALAESEKDALRRMFKSLNEIRKAQQCNQCVLVGHNAHFDLNFLNAAVARSGSKNQNPFHSFSVFDTVTLSAVTLGQTVLARACKQAGIAFDGNEAHSALYDTQKTAELFCKILNDYLPNFPLTAMP